VNRLEDAPPADPSAGEQGLGELVWSPPAFVGERAKRAKLRASGQAQVLALLALGTLIIAAVGPEIDATFRAGVGVLGVALMIGSVWGIGRAKELGAVHFAVGRRAVALPGSFASAPGISQLGPPVTLKLSRIKRFEDLRKPEGRAVIVWSGTGQGGVVSNAIGPVDLTPEEQETILDGFVAAMREVGVPEGRATEEDAD
jgi:hypothetical protein